MNYFDLHCDTISKCCNEKHSLYDNSLHLSLNRGKNYIPWFQCFAVWIPDEVRGKSATDFYDKVYNKLLNEIESHPEAIMLCKTEEDFKTALQEKKCGAVFTVEGGAAAAGSIERIRYMAQCGVKAITLTWNSICEMGDGAYVESPRGITDFGRLAVKEIENLHIAIDVSHASDALFYDVAECTKKPFIATHSNARSVCKNKRNLTDDEFNIIKKRGGIVGINFVSEFLNEHADSASLSDVIKHIEYFLSLDGQKALAIGSDFDGAVVPNDIKGVEYVENLAEMMLRRNYKEDLVNDILFQNAYRFFISL